MKGGELVKEARKRAGLSQQQLAELLATTQPVIARWENGRTAPSFARVVEAIRACGLDLGVTLVTPDEEHALHIEAALRIAPVERLRRQIQGQAAIEDLVTKVREQNVAV